MNGHIIGMALRWLVTATLAGTLALCSLLGISGCGHPGSGQGGSKKVFASCVQGEAEACSVRCLRGEWESCRTLELMHLAWEGVERNDQRAASLALKACEGGSMGACFDLGNLCLVGRGLEQNVECAFARFKQSCDGNYLEGCQGLALLYRAGVGVPKDEGKSRDILGRMCDSGHQASCVLLGRICLAQEKVPKLERDRAIELFANACANREDAGCMQIGLSLLLGSEAAWDPGAAARFFEKKCC